MYGKIFRSQSENALIKRHLQQVVAMLLQEEGSNIILYATNIDNDNILGKSMDSGKLDK